MTEFKEGQEVWIKGKVEDGIIIVFDEPIFKEDFPYVDIRTDLPEKPVIPKFVADWIRYCKSNKLTLLGAFDPVSENGIGLANTFTGEIWKGVDWAKRNQDIFACAWLYGYEIEKEKLYTVEIPNPNIDKSYITVLKRMRDSDNDIELCIFVKPDLSESKFHFTETEIRKDFEWAWQAGFAKEVD